MSEKREKFATRLGFILMAAGCAIGLGNVWRFPYITGKYGGGLFVLLYLFFLVVLGFPVMLMEISLGRGGQSTFPFCFKKLRTQDSRVPWHVPAYVLMSGNLILLSFYSVITGWIFAYVFFVAGDFFQKVEVTDCFSRVLANPKEQMVLSMSCILISVAICVGGVQKRIEKSIKFMMLVLFVTFLILIVHMAMIPNSSSGYVFFLKPSLENFRADGFWNVVHAAMAQAFFTLSLGIGSIAICGSYMNKERSLPKEGFWIIVLDTLVAVCSGLIIFPACAAYSVEANSGPALIFLTLPTVFHNMTGGFFWGTIFFVSLAIAALSTFISVFENIVAFGMEQWNMSRKKSSVVFGILLMLCSIPCILGFNLWSNVKPFGGDSTILDFEDFLVSDNLLPLGSMVLAIFCFSRKGWTHEGFFRELNAGEGWKIHPKKWLVWYCKWILPVLIFAIWLIGILKRFC